jgi:hypothetical protein
MGRTASDKVKLKDPYNQVINPATEETLQKLVGFEIPPYDDIVLSYTDGNLTKVEYKKDTVLVYTLNLSYTDGNLTRVWQ